MKYMLMLSLLAGFWSCTDSQKLEKMKTQSLSEISLDDSLKIAEKIRNFRPEDHVDMMQLIFGSPKHEIKEIGILVYDGVNELDLMGPRYIFGQAMGAQVRLINLKAGSFKTVMGVEIQSDAHIGEVDQLDILLIPGGFRGTIEAAYDKELHDWIRKIDTHTKYTASVCTGGWILGATGLLEGKRASTNWYREEEFLQKYKAIPAHERYTQEGKYWTSAGVTAGMDMSLAIMKDIYGERYAQAVMLDMEYDPDPPIEGGSPERSSWMVNWMMKAMYDEGTKPLIDSLEKGSM